MPTVLPLVNPSDCLILNVCSVERAPKFVIQSNARLGAAGRAEQRCGALADAFSDFPRLPVLIVCDRLFYNRRHVAVRASPVMSARQFSSSSGKPLSNNRSR